MTAKYQLLVHPELRDQLRKLHAEARQNPSGPEAKEFEAVRKGLSALRDGREADFSGERLGYSDRHADLRDCAEIKLPVVAEFNRRGRPMGLPIGSPIVNSKDQQLAIFRSGSPLRSNRVRTAALSRSPQDALAGLEACR
jgi:hypothetical protein